jgi:hypothetical protein
MSLQLNGDTGVTFNDASLQGAAASPFGLKNRLINADMRIDQRNAGASITPTVATYTLDRWFAGLSQASKYSIEQTISGVAAPAGFTDYLGVTSTSAYSVLTGEIFKIQQAIEGFNIADLGWGTANAKTITISFWVRSSLTGTFGGSILNETAARNYPFTYSIPAANTWTQISVTIVGDTSGTWNTTNGVGMYVIWGLGVGSTFSGTAGAWAAGNIQSATGAVSVVGTNGATFYITGVQLEVGSTATPFERRLYGTELAHCQRYYNKWSGANSQNIGLTTCVANGGTTPGIRRASWANPVDFRSAPTLGLGGTIQVFTSGLSNLGFVSFNGSTSSKNIISFDINTTSSGTAGQGIMVIIDSPSAANYIEASAEL